jgi:hypothetical protein
MCFQERLLSTIASKRAIVGAAIGTPVGLLLGLPGILVGPFLGAVLGELSAQRNLHAAGHAMRGRMARARAECSRQFAIVFSMLGVFALVRFL